ncbi:hypothetical protein GCM10020221_16030 [Streptomyces thioluteus]|uniref:Uncharacterized protein n=1 Tax=Streptomyces thioluteus TaxID=66431 RepID=A0ABN3WMN6_STRTU
MTVVSHHGRVRRTGRLVVSGASIPGAAAPGASVPGASASGGDGPGSGLGSVVAVVAGVLGVGGVAGGALLWVRRRLRAGAAGR